MPLQKKAKDEGWALGEGGKWVLLKIIFQKQGKN